MSRKGPGKSLRKDVSLRELFRKLPDDATSEAWFIERRWPSGIACLRCASANVQSGAKHKTTPYRCREKQCAKRFKREDGHGHGELEARLSGVDDRHLSALHVAQVGVRHEAAPAT